MASTVTLESGAVQKLASVFVENYYIKQFGKFFLMKEVSLGVWEGPNHIDINPELRTENQVVIDSYSGTQGKHIFTPQELFDLADGSSGAIELVFAEDIDSGLGIAGDDLETNLAKILIVGGLPIWSFEII